MAQNKKEEFKKSDLELADFAKAISHPARVAILKTISKKNMCICGEIVDVLPLSQSTVSQHLRELLKAGLLEGTVDGTKSCYCINWKAFARFSKGFNEFFNSAKSRAESFEKKKCC
ncbi:MAG TPA: metalloregulator ArsR/SmtB family transcription factor [Ignavibacteria bacterium]|nr:metalloregulator ArsR/SmtB family transcription factor [Ignavibacteria bacterium]HMR41007.1 metalloregulator ArsR/SmtB family transcription factor [Ignavibacteria bacterium]